MCDVSRQHSINKKEYPSSEWNCLMRHTWPFDKIISELNLGDKVEKLKQHIFFPVDRDEIVLPMNHVNLDRAVSLTCYIFNKNPPEHNPEKEVEFIITTFKNSNKLSLMDKYCKDARKFFGVERINCNLSLLHCMFARLPVDPGVSDVNPYFDLDLKIHVPEESKRRYRSKLHKIISNNLFTYSSFYFFKTKLNYSSENSFIQKLEGTMKGGYYALLDPQDDRLKVAEKTASKCKFKDSSLRICSNDENIFKMFLEITTRFREDTVNKSILKDMTSPQIYKKKGISEGIRKLVWKHYNTYDVAKAPCFCCGGDVNISDYQCGHIVSERNGGAAVVKNLLPICGTCNRNMGIKHLFEWTTDNFDKCRCFDLDIYKEWLKVSRSKNLHSDDPLDTPTVKLLQEKSLEVKEALDGEISDILNKFIKTKCNAGPENIVKIRDFHNIAKKFINYSLKEKSPDAKEVKASDIRVEMSKLSYDFIKNDGFTYYMGISIRDKAT